MKGKRWDKFSERQVKVLRHLALRDDGGKITRNNIVDGMNTVLHPHPKVSYVKVISYEDVTKTLEKLYEGGLMTRRKANKNSPLHYSGRTPYVYHYLPGAYEALREYILQIPRPENPTVSGIKDEMYRIRDGDVEDNSIPINDSVPVSCNDMTYEGGMIVTEDPTYKPCNNALDFYENDEYARRKAENEIIEELIATATKDRGQSNVIYDTSGLYHSILSRLARNKAWIKGFEAGRESL